MNIRFHKKFKKRYSNLPAKLQLKVDEAIFEFVENPLNPILKNHKLSGRMKDIRAFSVTGDIRVIFREWEDYTEVLMLDVGTHNQVY